MRSLALLLSTAALCSALVTPDQKTLLDTFLESQTEVENKENTESLWNVPATFSKTDPELASDSLGLDKSSDRRIHLLRYEDENCSLWPGHPGHPTLGYPSRSGPDDPCQTPNECSSNSTVWELISQGHDTKQLAAMMSKDNDLITLLSSTEHHFTIFAPTDRALDRLRGRDQFLSMKDMMRYHVVLGLFSLKDLKAFEHQTLPTALNVTTLGKAKGDVRGQYKNKTEDKDKDLPQRLRVDMVRHSVVLNGESGIIAGNIVRTPLLTPLLTPFSTDRRSDILLDCQKWHHPPNRHPSDPAPNNKGRSQYSARAIQHLCPRPLSHRPGQPSECFRAKDRYNICTDKRRIPRTRTSCKRVPFFATGRRVLAFVTEVSPCAESDDLFGCCLWGKGGN